MRFTCCLNMAFTWQSLSAPWFVCMTLHGKALRPWLIISPMILFAKSWPHIYNVVATLGRSKVWRWRHLFREIQCKKRDILMLKPRFQCGLGWNQVKYARITITHVCLIALPLAGFLGRCLNTLPNGLVFKQLPRDRQMLMHAKTCVNPILQHS